MEIAKLLQLEVRDKKRTASGIHSKKGKRGYVGVMLTPLDFMSRKEKYNYRKSSKVVVTNMYDTIINYEDFLNLSREEQRKHLIEYRNRFTNKDIASVWGVNNSRLSYLIDKLEIPKAARKTKKDKESAIKSSKKPSIAEQAAALVKKLEESKKEIVQEVKEEVVVQAKPELLIPIGDGLNLQLKGEYAAAEIQSKLERFALVLEDDKRYNVQIVISEVTNDK